MSVLLHNLYVPYILALDLTVGDVVDNNGPECHDATAVENSFVLGIGFDL